MLAHQVFDQVDVSSQLKCLLNAFYMTDIDCIAVYELEEPEIITDTESGKTAMTLHCLQFC